MHGAWHVGRIAGIRIGIDPSWGVIAVLITFNFWHLFSDPVEFPEVDGGRAVVLAVVTAALFFGSVLAHELAHAGLSRARGIPVAGITLFLFGGATHARVDAKGPLDEFLVTVVGPATSAALGGLFLAGDRLAGHGLPDSLRSMLGTLGVVNLTLAGFNLLPGFPLDGGRLLRSALWRATGDLVRATRVAGWVGQGVGLAIAAAGVGLYAQTHDAFSLLWPAFVGWFLFRAAGAGVREVEQRRVLRSTTVAEVMAPPPPAVPADLPLVEATARYLAGHEGEAFPVMEAGRVLGFVSARTARGMPGDRPVREAAVPGRGVVEAGPGETMDDLVERMGQRLGMTVLVLDGGRLVGVIEPEDLARFLRSRRGWPG
ncbi:MAG TPA: site-2 protease family protein [Actinomycetota bacterium]|nr:site-2 protease family protein [Actinomycetota bacterium]